ncbi:hypothetical protein [Sphaerochaeta sp. PS]|uniref:hypothetical protein n=1 Tax=Sphaerochaeta sp. PS TaxID=3076336 RepID=UPI0028A3A273|nr:hypothetical protein [Sphaerochaeta sp. PS]MDT4762278.1 hypothetical protein [Sphaerochaeta sp. PS]
MNKPSLGDILRKTKWRQGVVLEGVQKEKVLANATESYPWMNDADALVLFSHDCDLLNHSLENEPFAEFFCAKYVDNRDPSLAYGKNPRKIHLVVDGSKNVCLLFNHRIRINRACLIGLPLDADPLRVSEVELRTLLSWVSKKYSRSAFPDAFNVQLGKIPELDKKLRNLNIAYPAIKAIFFCLSPNTEIGDEQSYSLQVKVLLEGKSSDTCEELKSGIEERLEQILSVDRIIINDITCEFENEMTLLELAYFKVWDMDYISRRYGFAL